MSVVGHGGDADGNPPGGHWNPPRSHISEEAGEEARQKRGKTANKELRDLWKANGSRPLDIRFDTHDQRTIKHVGPHGQMLTSLVGTHVNDNEFPKHFDSWAKVPTSLKTQILRDVEKYFDMRSLYDGGKKEAKAKAGVEWTCKDRYRDAKYQFKKQHFTERGGYEALDHLIDSPPHGVDREKIWIPFVQRVTNPKHMSTAEKNSINRSKQKFHSKHGSRSYAIRRDKRKEDEGEYPSLIDDWQEHHTSRDDGSWDSPEAAELHQKMLDLRANSTSGTSEEEILEEVLGKRSGHNRGRGRKLPNWITGSLATLTGKGKGKGKGKAIMQEENMVRMSDITKYMQSVRAANPNFVIPDFQPSNQPEEEEEEPENVDDDDEDDE